MWAHPGKKLLFMGQEFAQEAEWSEKRSLDWHLLEDPEHAGIQSLVRDLNRAYKAEPALWEMDFDGTGFWWIEANDADDNVFAFARRTKDSERVGVFVGNFSPAVREDYRIGLPRSGRWREAVNTDATYYGGSGVGNMGGVEAEAVGWHGQPFSAEVTLPPLGALWLVPEDDDDADERRRNQARCTRSTKGVWRKNAASWDRCPAGSGWPAPAWPWSGGCCPGSPQRRIPCWFWGLVALTVAYSLACITRLIPWERVSIDRARAGGRGALQPLVVRRAVADRRRRTPTWARCSCCRCSTSPTSSRPATRGRWRRSRSLTYASPLVTSRAAGEHQLLARTLGYAVAYGGPGGDDPVPQAPPGRRRAPPAPHGPRRPAHRACTNRRGVRRGPEPSRSPTGERFTLLLVDVDYFKQINDRFGHTTGDRVLRELAAHTSAVVRTGDCLARIGGDEFALVAPGAGSDAARRLADALREAGAHVDSGDGPLSLTVSARRLPARTARTASRSCAPSTASCTP